MLSSPYIVGLRKKKTLVAERRKIHNRLSALGGAVRTVSLIGTNFGSSRGAVASTVYTNGGIVRGFIPGYIATRQVYGPTYGAEYTVSSKYYKYFEMNHVVEAFIVLLGGINTMAGLFTLISWASEGLHSKPIGLLNIDGYFNNLIKFLDDAVKQNFMALNQRKLFISSFFIDELLDKLAFTKAFPEVSEYDLGLEGHSRWKCPGLPQLRRNPCARQQSPRWCLLQTLHFGCFHTLILFMDDVD
ncbi:hypothetical protein DM860_012313 [Cuscuta australis]|uniref:cytokinin riboside 5'-monophosphate phosphoribohydrolase n=1 Tax=Cuscuta australis TaxID=267555 RepID=A0A328DSY0_9ASTE|nr:hypothetical protein DM860_012313 [Cuscuta australis]